MQWKSKLKIATPDIDFGSSQGLTNHQRVPASLVPNSTQQASTDAGDKHLNYLSFPEWGLGRSAPTSGKV